MSIDIDCLVIGHNEMDFSQYEKTVRNMGVRSGAYRDLDLNFVTFNGKPYALADMFNLAGARGQGGALPGPLSMGESFSASVAYLGTYLHRRGLTFDYVNHFRGREEELARKLAQNRVLTVAITTTYYISVAPILEIVDFIRRHAPEVKIVIGGPFISTQVRNRDPMAVEYLFQSTIGADFYVNDSQGETALVKIIEALKSNGSVEGIPNIYYKAPGEQGYRSTPVEAETNRLEENMVDWNLFSGGVGEFVNIRTAVSCPFACSFCGFPEHAGPYQTAPVEAVERELLQLKRFPSIKSVHFVDDTFNVPPKRFKEILRMMIEHRLPFKWHSYFRCQYADQETVDLMKQSGCEGVFLGIESGSGAILKNMNKAVTTQQYLEGIRLLKSAGIVTFGNFIIGFPGETDETVRQTMRFIEDSGLDFFRVQLWYCEPVTPIYKQRETFGIRGESFEWEHNTMNAAAAGDWVEKIFRSDLGPTWVPQYNFDFATLWHLVHRGMGLDRVKEFLTAFTGGVKGKLNTPGGAEVSPGIIRRLKQALPWVGGEPAAPASEPSIDEDDAEFDF